MTGPDREAIRMEVERIIDSYTLCMVGANAQEYVSACADDVLMEALGWPVRYKEAGMPERTANSTAPPWWPPQSGDVAVFQDCADGGLPYRVCVTYNFGERAWMNAGTGGILPRQPYPGDLVVLVRRGEPYA